MSNRSPRPLPPEIYMRRRVAAAVILLLVVSLVIWGLTAFAKRGGQDTEPTPSPTPTTISSAARSTEVTAAEEPTGKDTDKDAEKPADKATEKDAAKSCELGDLKIVATSDRPSYGEGVQPTFYMTVENPTPVDCEINLDDDELRFEVYNLKNNERVWADTDCYPSVLTGEETFPAGEERRFQAVWSRLGSKPGQCNNRQDVGTGSFFLHAVIGDNPSDAHTFNLG